MPIDLMPLPCSNTPRVAWAEPSGRSASSRAHEARGVMFMMRPNITPVTRKRQCRAFPFTCEGNLTVAQFRDLADHDRLEPLGREPLGLAGGMQRQPVHQRAEDVALHVGIEVLAQRGAALALHEQLAQLLAERLV